MSSSPVDKKGRSRWYFGRLLLFQLLCFALRLALLLPFACHCLPNRNLAPIKHENQNSSGNNQEEQVHQYI